jgi:transcription antitermination factor NusG
MSEELDLSWAEGQIAAARVPVPVGKAVITLLKAWAEINFPNEAQQVQALDLFSTLARNEAVVEETEAVWKPVQVGFMLNVGDTVRVRKDAFTEEAGRTHNGRIGRVLAKRSGDIIVRTTDDRLPYLDGAHYPASALELRVS